MRIKINLLIVLVFILTRGTAQFWLGYHTSNYSGVHKIGFNPATVTDNRYKLDFNLVSFNMNVTNSYVGFKDGFIGGMMGGDPNFTANYVHERGPGEGLDINSMFLHNEVMGPAVMLSFENQGFALSVRARNYFNIDGVDDTLAHTIMRQLDYPTIFGVPMHHNGFSVQDLLWVEYDLSYGRVLYNSGDHYLKGGVTLKLLQGLSSAYVYSDALQLTVESESSISMAGDLVAYGHSDNFDHGYLPPFSFVSKPGIGLDIGFSYEWRPDHMNYTYDMDGEEGLYRPDKNKYKLRAEAAIVDMGSMTFTKGEISHDFNPTIDNWDLSNMTFDDFVYSFDDTLANTFPSISNDPTYKMSLPTAITLGVDYHIIGDAYVNFTAIQAFQFKKRYAKVHSLSTYAITPRYDWKWFGFYMPVSYNQLDQFNVGASAMIGPIVIGTQNLLPMFTSATVNGLDFYFGLKASWLNNLPKDTDEDKISDKVDQCIEIPGTWALKGCPDTDGDGITDTEDKCPKVAGTKEHGGCPDTDGDGIIDQKDDCPEEAGLLELAGCPDADGDGIKDSDDQCPDEIGLLEFLGCPDRDGDKVIDKQDACPDKPGDPEHQGCPDTDDDGLYDNEDDCIEKAGPLDNKGCPYEDKDGDGIIDPEDECPDEAGPLSNKGCPVLDWDEDGVLNEEDECPNTPGVVENNGCPELEKEEEEILNTAFNDLEFESGKAVIKFESHASLDELGVLLSKKTEWKLKLSGHTDNVGSAQGNLQLSKDRAQAVKQYLMDRGIDESRITVEFYGETMPIETNDTPEGRQKNRRVEMKVLFE